MERHWQCFGLLRGRAGEYSEQPNAIDSVTAKELAERNADSVVAVGPGDGRGSSGFATRSSLRAALLKVNLGQLAQQFQ